MLSLFFIIDKEIYINIIYLYICKNKSKIIYFYAKIKI